jgi:hypothetical protein
MRTEYLAIFMWIFLCAAGVGAGLLIDADGVLRDEGVRAAGSVLSVRCQSNYPRPSWSDLFSAVSASDRSVLHLAYPAVPLEDGVVIPVDFPDIEQMFGRYEFISVFGTDMLSRL